MLGTASYECPWTAAASSHNVYKKTATAPSGVVNQKADPLVWHGEVSDFRAQIASYQVYGLPSFCGGTPRSVLETMAIRRPIITADTPGCFKTVFEVGNGFLVPTREIVRLVDAMERSVKDPDLATIGQRSRKIPETKFDLERINAQMAPEMDLA